MNPSLQIYEVSLRDGLQNESKLLPTDTKVQLLDRLVASGVKDIEVGAFVSPRWIPQMADTGELFGHVHKYSDDIRFWALIPNRRGLERALDVDVRHVATFLSASETHNMKNLNRTIRESISNLQTVIATAKSEGLLVRSYISTVFGCPYEGEVPVQNTVTLATALLDAGADQIALGDTTGMGQPEQVKQVITTLLDSGLPLERLAVHLHDTRGTALVNAYAAWQMGIRCFDGSVGGIGGCPYAKGATGNAATEDLVNLFNEMDCPTHVDLDALCEAGNFMEGQLDRNLSSRMLKVWQAQAESQAVNQTA